MKQSCVITSLLHYPLLSIKTTVNWALFTNILLLAQRRHHKYKKLSNYLRQLIIKTTLHNSQTTQLVSDIEHLTIANVLQPTVHVHSKTTFILHN